ncbi:hypothetical protein HKX48_004205 [Thoreauomyces humboldtii]|nr:hypothetical protein HKX48_004205 [Thoreauomyces humboldtii]
MSFFSFGEPETSHPTSNAQLSLPPVAPVKLVTYEDQLERRLAVIAEPIQTRAGPLFKRNAADVKFEIASTDDMEGGNMLAQAVISQTDLVPGVYEGGLKTWECAVDLVDYLAGLDTGSLKGQRVLELGCGSSLPGIYCLSQGATVDLQDYNEEVLHLVTIPNVLLNATPGLIDAAGDGHESGTCEVELEYSKLANIPARFWAGDWGLLQDALANAEKYDVILTAETIYASESHQRLLDLISSVIRPGGVAYIAAKTTYFGCSGSLPMFLHLVKTSGKAMDVETVWVESSSVRREIVRIRF